MRSAGRAAALAAFLFLVVPLVAYCAWQMPTGQAPDEPTHVIRAASLLRGEIIGHRVARPNGETGAPDAGVTGNTGLALAAIAGNGDMAPLPAGASRAARLAWVRAIPWQPHSEFISSANTAAYAPVAYVPAALGLGAAILIGAKPHAAILAARFANVLVFALVGALALCLAERGRLLLLVTLSLPMTVWLAASCNQDGVLIACATLAIALLTRTGSAAFWWGSALLAVIVLQKPPFIPLALLPLIASGHLNPRDWKRRLAGVLTVAIPGTLWAVAVMILVSVPLRPGAPYQPGPLWPGDPTHLFRSAVSSAQLSVIMHHPVRVALLPITGNGSALPSLWLQFIGVLGDLSIRLSHHLYALWSLALLSALAATGGDQRGVRDRVTPMVVGIAILATIELIFISQYLTWTPVGMTHIDGVQGRYFIPLLPALLFIVPNIIGRLRIPSWVWWTMPIAAIIAMDATLPGLIQAHYYR